MAKEKYAFRCKNCGALETSEQAGERDFPAACRICGHGVRYDPLTGDKEYLNEENWTVLSDLSSEELEKERVVKKSDGKEYAYWDSDDIKIVKHKAAPSTVPEGREPQAIEREAEESLGAEDRTS